MSITTWAKAHKKQTAGIAVAAVVAVSLIVAGVGGAFSPKGNDTGHETVSSQTSSDSSKTDEAKAQDVAVSVKADDGWTKDSSPVILHVATSDDKADGAVDFYHAVTPSEDNKASDTIKLAPGQYTVEVVSPLNSDGSAMVVYNTSGDQNNVSVVSKSTITVTAPVDEMGTADKDKSNDDATVKSDSKAEIATTDDGNKVDISLTKVPADKVTDDMVSQIVEKTKDAVNNGDETLKGDAGKSVLDKVESNAKANPNVSEETKKKAEDAKATSDTSTESAKSTVTPAPTKSDNDSAQKSDNSSSTPAKNADTNNGSGSSSSAPAQKQKTWVPEKGHWENTTEQVWVSNIVTVVDKPAYDEKVVDKTYLVYAYDGYRTADQSEAEAHSTELILAGHPDNFHYETTYKTVHHDAVTHTEDQGHYETKVTGKKWVVDEAGHYE